MAWKHMPATKLAAVLRDFISLWLHHFILSPKTSTHGTPHHLNTENLLSTPFRSSLLPLKRGQDLGHFASLIYLQKRVGPFFFSNFGRKESLFSDVCLVSNSM